MHNSRASSQQHASTLDHSESPTRVKTRAPITTTPRAPVSGLRLQRIMASEDTLGHLAESGITMHSDSEQYSPAEELSPSPPSSGSPIILYKPPTLWSLLRGATINLLLPFINGMMLGFGELFAHEAAFRLGWGGTKVCAYHVLSGELSFCLKNSKNRLPEPTNTTMTGIPHDPKASSPHWSRHRSPRATSTPRTVTG